MKNDGYKYRVCKKCSNKWNVSILTKKHVSAIYAHIAIRN